MGPQASRPTELKPKSIGQIIDYIATHYILTMDFVGLHKLYEKEFCNKMIILTADIIEKDFTNMEIEYLAQRIKDGVEVNDMKPENVTIVNRENIDNQDIQSSVRKRRMCVAISKFYVKIGHLFAAIVTTLNPIYIYNNENGERVTANIYEKGNIPPNTPRQILKWNICEKRINSLKRGMPNDLSEASSFTIHPTVCSINITKSGELKDLEDEPGIPELMDLYFDDKYENGKFTGMSEKTEKVYREDLKIFYDVFSDKSVPFDKIVRFSDIKLRNFRKQNNCVSGGPLNTRVTGTLSNSLFADYAENLNEMMYKTEKNRDALLGILNKLFVYTTDPSGKRRTRISPNLTETKLQNIIGEARGIIIKLYLTCEINYVKGISIYEAIVEKKIFETSKNQIHTLEEMRKKLSQEL
jgi:hypothetical protein